MPTVSAPGKLILFGEHAVVYDKLGVATAIDIHTTATASLSENKTIRITAQDYGKKTEASADECLKTLEKVEQLREQKNFDALKVLAKDLFAPIKVVLAKTLQEYDHAGGIEFKISSKIPKASGLGSGSAVFVSAATAAQACMGELDLKKIAEASYLGDVVAHAGTPSGIDNNTITHGGYVSFKKSEGIRPMKVAAKLSIVIGNTNLQSPTGEMVSMVRKQRETSQEKIDDVMNQIEEKSRAGIKAIERQDIEELGELMNQNHELLCKLGVSHPLLEKLVKASLDAGALGAKLSGAGGGGVMFALCENEESMKKVEKAILRSEGTPIKTTTGAQGVKAF